MKRIIAIFFLFILLSSNAGFAMTTHLCGGKPMETAVRVGHSDLDCGMAMDKIKFNYPVHNEDAAWLSDVCCENEFLDMESDDAIAVKVKTADLHPEFVAVLVYAWAGLIQLNKENYSSTSFYSPPLLEQDLPALHQVFII